MLDNGVTLITEDLRSARTFSIGVFAKVGSRHETARLHGASHFLEHVLFKGTKRRSAEEISAAVESVGGELNAYTAKEHTCFYARVLHTDALLAVDVLIDMLTHSVIREADLDAERSVILDEIAMHADDPAEVAQELISGAIFADAGLGKPVIGSPATIAAMSRSQLLRYWRTHYRPAGLVVAAAGQVDHDWLSSLLSAIPAAEAASTRHTRPTLASTEGGVLLQPFRLEQSTAVMAYPSPGVFDDRRFPLGLLSLILGGGMASRLFVEIRERRGLTYGIDAGETTYSDAGTWSVDWQCAPDKVADIATLVKTMLADVATDGVTEVELKRAKGQMRGQTALSYESPGSRMNRHGVNAVLGDTRTLGELLDCFDAVTADQVRAEAARMFAQPATLAVVGPKLGVRAQRQLDAATRA